MSCHPKVYVLSQCSLPMIQYNSYYFRLLYIHYWKDFDNFVTNKLIGHNLALPLMAMTMMTMTIFYLIIILQINNIIYTLWDKQITNWSGDYY